MTDDAAGRPLADRIRALIRTGGPIGVDTYMTLCLADPQAGYYTTREPFGAAGDFVTAPEVSQMFGELIGVFLRALWHDEGRPEPVCLAELGPGRGTLMADMLRVLAGDSDLSAALSVHLIETSPRLRAVQAETLARTGAAPMWHDGVRTLPPGRLYAVANEFFDALPIRQFVFDGTAWSERVVGLDATGALAFGLGPARFDPAEHGLDLAAPRPGTVVEVSPQRAAAAGELAERLAAGGGAALVIDYGHAAPGRGDTLQAVKAHRYVDVLADPGGADLTAHVDFAALAEVFSTAGLAVHPLKSQAEFLLDMGLLERAGRLGADKDAAVRDVIRGQVERLAGAEQMGSLFKVLCVTGGKRAPFPFATDRT